MSDTSPGAATHDAVAHDELLDSEAAGRYIGGDGSPVAEATLRQWRYRGEGPPFIRVGGKFARYRRSDLDAWLEARRVVPSHAVPA